MSDTMLQFCRHYLPDCTRLEKLCGDVSSREYFRVHGSSASFILCHDEHLCTIGAANYPFLITTNLLREAGLPVPGVIAVDESRGLLLQQDCGQTDLETVVLDANTPPAVIENLYRQAVDVMLGIQSVQNTEGLLPFTLSFDLEKFGFEAGFFLEHFVRGWCRADEKIAAQLQQKCEHVNILLQKPELFVLNHRDYHSRNIMVCGANIAVIDHQDARLGLPQYDAVSLCEDPYVPYNEERVVQLKDYYFQKGAAAGMIRQTRDEFDYYYDLQCWQRLTKALGTYGYQLNVRKQNRFASSVAAALLGLERLAARRPEFVNVVTMLRDIGREAR